MLKKIELIGYGNIKQLKNLPFGMGNGFKYSGWIAMIVGYDSKYKYKRQFLKGDMDFTQANSKNTRGVYLNYYMEDGYYQISESISWKQTDKYFCKIEGDELIKIDEFELEEAIECLKTI